MGLPITSATGNLLVGAAVGTASAIACDVAEDNGVGTLGQVGIALGIGVPGAMLTRGHTFPYIGGVLAASLGVSGILDAMEK
jgi:hypothetical protein